MKDRRFHRAVVVTGASGRFRYVLSAADAGRVLLREWPAEQGRKHTAACNAVLDVLKGNKPPSHARRAFVAASREAGILSDEGLTEFEALYPEFRARHRNAGSGVP